MYSSILALTFGTLAAATAIPRASNSTWTVQYSQTDYTYGYQNKQLITAFNDAALSAPKPGSCLWVKSPSKGVSDDGCSPSSLSYELTGTEGKQSISLNQTVTIDGQDVAFVGKGEITITCDAASGDLEGTVCTGQATIPATKA